VKTRFSLALPLLLVVAVAMSGAVASAQQTTIKFAVWDFSMSPEYAIIIDEFQKENPDIKVEVIDIAAAEYPDKMTVMLAAGEEVDVFAVKDFASYSNYLNRNYLTPLNEFVERDGIDLAPYGAALDYVKHNGQLMGLPYRSDIYILYYNKDIFDAAGVPYPSNEMTWQEFRETAKKLTSGEGANKIWGAYIHSWRSQVQCPILLTTNLTLIDGDYSFLKPAYELVLGMQNEDKSIMSFAEIRTSNTHYRGLFETGRVGMLWMGTWFIGSLLVDEHDVNWGIAASPYWPGSNPGDTVSGLTTLAINSKSTKKDAAWKLVSHFGGIKGARVFASRGVLPGLRTPEVLEIYTSAEGFPEGGKEALVTGRTTVELPPSVYANALDKMLSEEHSMIMTGQVSLEQGLKNMAERAKEIKEDW
jgi:multiple sugar transport system substrate-binding protein